MSTFIYLKQSNPNRKYSNHSTKIKSWHERLTISKSTVITRLDLNVNFFSNEGQISTFPQDLRAALTVLRFNLDLSQITTGLALTRPQETSEPLSNEPPLPEESVKLNAKDGNWCTVQRMLLKFLQSKVHRQAAFSCHLWIKELKVGVFSERNRRYFIRCFYYLLFRVWLKDPYSYCFLLSRVKSEFFFAFH